MAISCEGQAPTLLETFSPRSYCGGEGVSERKKAEGLTHKEGRGGKSERGKSEETYS